MIDMKKINVNSEMTDFSPLRDKLRSEAEIMAQWTGGVVPLVSVCCATFNHVKWIEDAICGFLAQETDFPFEIIISDDASTDGTTEIIRGYANLYPKIIRLFINEINHFSLGEHPMLTWPNIATGKYVALCEGDDYWLSPTKLEKQVILMEENPSAVMAVARTHKCKTDESSGILTYISTTPNFGKVFLNEDDVDKIYYHTSTYMIKMSIFREIINKYFVGQNVFGDTAMRTFLIDRGPFVYLADVVSVYRITGEGIWTSLDREKQLLWEIENSRNLSKIFTGAKQKKHLKNLTNLKVSLLVIYIKKRKIQSVLKFHPLIYVLITKRFLGFAMHSLKNQLR